MTPPDLWEKTRRVVSKRGYFMPGGEPDDCIGKMVLGGLLAQEPGKWEWWRFWAGATGDLRDEWKKTRRRGEREKPPKHMLHDMVAEDPWDEVVDRIALDQIIEAAGLARMETLAVMTYLEGGRTKYGGSKSMDNAMYKALGKMREVAE